MSAEKTSNTNAPPGVDADLESKVYSMRGELKLVRYLVFGKAAGKRPTSLRVMVGSPHGTALTLKNKSFSAQYRRAVDMIATFHGIPQGDPIRQAMEATAPHFLAFYNLHTEASKIERDGELHQIEDT